MGGAAILGAGREVPLYVPRPTLRVGNAKARNFARDDKDLGATVRDEARINAELLPIGNIILGPGLCTFQHWGGIPWQSNRIGWI